MSAEKVSSAVFEEGAAGDQLGGLEEVLGAEEYELRVLKDGAARDGAFDQVDVGGPRRTCRRAARDRRGWIRTAPGRAGRGSPYSLKMSARRSTSPVADAKNATLLPASTSVRASAMATCMLPWKPSTAAWRCACWSRAPEGDQPISSCWKTTWRSTPWLGVRVPPSGRRRGPDRRPASARSAPAVSRGARPPPAPDPARPRSRSGAPAARRPTHCAAGASGRRVPIPGTARPEAAGRGRGCRLRASVRAARQKAGAISDTPSTAAAVHSSTFSTDRCDSTSKRRMDSTWSPNRSMRTGFCDSGENTSRIPPRTEYSPTISTGSRRS